MAVYFHGMISQQQEIFRNSALSAAALVKGVYWKEKNHSYFFSNTEKHFSDRLPVEMCGHPLLRVACTYPNNLSTSFGDSSCVFCVGVCVSHSPPDTDNNLFTFFDPSTWERLCCAVHLSSNTLYAYLNSQILILSLCIFTVLTLQYHLSPHQHHLEVKNKSHNSGTYTQRAFRRNLISHLVPECAGNRVITVESFLAQKFSSIQKPLFSSYVLTIT